jgi:hypothetical protein
MGGWNSEVGSDSDILSDAGLYCPSDNLALVKFLHVACYQSNLPYVEKLLDYGVNHTARAG